MRPHFIVVASPRSNFYPRLRQRFKPMLVQTLIPKLAVKALNVRAKGTGVDFITVSTTQRAESMGSDSIDPFKTYAVSTA